MFAMHCLEVTLEALTPLSFDTYCGSAFRGAFFRSLWGKFCANREAPTCEACPLVLACPVASLVAPLREESPRGRNMPPPYMITPPYRDNGRYEAGEHLSFSLTLMGNATILYPYVVRAFQEMENSTIGHPLAELGGRRGKIALHTIHAIHPITQEKQLLWERGTKKQPATPRHLIQAADITTRADQFPTDHLTINFLSPTRIIANERVQRHVTFPILIARLAQRLEQIQHEYSNDPLIEETTRGKEWYLSLKEQAAGVQVERDETRWIEVFSHSSRKKQSMSIGGIVGKVAFKGNIAPLRELLAWGELLRVGKNVAKGGGRYLIEW